MSAEWYVAPAKTCCVHLRSRTWIDVEDCFVEGKRGRRGGKDGGRSVALSNFSGLGVGISFE